MISFISAAVFAAAARTWAYAQGVAAVGTGLTSLDLQCFGVLLRGREQLLVFVDVGAQVPILRAPPAQ